MTVEVGDASSPELRTPTPSANEFYSIYTNVSLLFFFFDAIVRIEVEVTT